MERRHTRHITSYIHIFFRDLVPSSTGPMLLLLRRSPWYPALLTSILLPHRLVVAAQYAALRFEYLALSIWPCRYPHSLSSLSCHIVSERGRQAAPTTAAAVEIEVGGEGGGRVI